MAFTGTKVLKYETRDRKAYITLNRPEAMNALNGDLIDGIAQAVEAFQNDNELLVAILTGEGGRAFCAGADLKEMTRRDQIPGSNAVRAGRNGLLALRDCSKPLIAAIDGYSLAGGLELTVYCDIRIATTQSKFGLPEPRRSLLAGPGLHNLSRMIPLGEALYIQLTGSHVSAERMYQIGWLQRLVSDRAALFKEADAIADEILQCAPLAVQAIKRIVKVGRGLPVQVSEQIAEPIQAAINQTEDRLEGPRAFAEKRSPVWKMR